MVLNPGPGEYDEVILCGLSHTSVSDLAVQGGSGVFVLHSTDLLLSDLSLRDSTYGLHLRNSSVIVREAHIGHNTWDLWEETSPSWFYDNLFETTEFFLSSSHLWNTTQDCGTQNILGGPCLGGNAWPDYTGMDEDGDGLGESPYLLPNGDRDFLPLTTPHRRSPSKPSPPKKKHRLVVGDLHDLTVNQGEWGVQSLSIWNLGDYQEEVRVEVYSSLPHSQETTLHLSPGESAQVEIRVLGERPGEYVVSVGVYGEIPGTGRSFLLTVLPSETSSSQEPGGFQQEPQPPSENTTSEGGEDFEEEQEEVELRGPKSVFPGIHSYRVLVNGRPARNLSVNLTLPSGEVICLRTDEAGYLRLNLSEEGEYFLDVGSESFALEVSAPEKIGEEAFPRPLETPSSDFLPVLGFSLVLVVLALFTYLISRRSP